MASSSTHARRTVRARGFTLIEVLVSLVVLTVGILAAFQALDASMRALALCRDDLWADLALRQVLADLGLTVAAGGALPDRSDGWLATPYGAYRWEADAFAVAGPPGADGEGTPRELREVALAVWREGSARRHAAVTYFGVGRGGAAPGAAAAGPAEADR